MAVVSEHPPEVGLQRHAPRLGDDLDRDVLGQRILRDRGT